MLAIFNQQITTNAWTVTTVMSTLHVLIQLDRIAVNVTMDIPATASPAQV
jgi:hypothetical protein